MRSLIAVLLFLVLLTPACGGGQANPQVPQATQAPTTAPQPRTVTYKVESSARSTIDLTYRNETGGTAQETSVTPWTKTFPATAGQVLYLSAQNTKKGGGDVTCTISVNDEVVQQANSEGSYVIASCSGSVPK